MTEIISEEFVKRFGGEPLIVRSPGRINLIGEHTDYNAGFVMPAAINKYIAFALAPGKDNYRFFSQDLQEEYTIVPNKIKPDPKYPWVNYLLGVIAEYNKRGVEIPPFDCVFGEIYPLGQVFLHPQPWSVGWLTDWPVSLISKLRTRN